jgi:DTW domain-containing protein
LKHQIDILAVEKPHRVPKVLILQHPGEARRKTIRSADLLQEVLVDQVITRVGLTWRNLDHAVGEKGTHPKSWVVLYLGSLESSQILAKSRGPGLYFANTKLEPVPADGSIEGIVLLDATWPQAKSMWWKNSWLLKLHRAVLKPRGKSQFKELRKEPRAECVSTLEAAAESLSALGAPIELEQRLKEAFLKRVKSTRDAGDRPSSD